MICTTQVLRKSKLFDPCRDLGVTARTALLSKGGGVAKPCDGHIDLYPVPADCLG